MDETNRRIEVERKSREEEKLKNQTKEGKKKDKE